MVRTCSARIGVELNEGITDVETVSKRVLGRGLKQLCKNEGLRSVPTRCARKDPSDLGQGLRVLVLRNPPESQSAKHEIREQRSRFTGASIKVSLLFGDLLLLIFSGLWFYSAASRPARAIEIIGLGLAVAGASWLGVVAAWLQFNRSSS